MGIFKDFATSPLGDFTIGALSEFEDRAARDVVVNATASQNSLDKETKAFNEYETAFKNKSEIANILAANPDAFGLSMQEGLDINQVADRFTNFMFKQNRSIFEGTDMDKVKLNVAKFMAQNPGQGFTIYDPYIAGEDRFKREQELHQARISAITKMPRADKLLMNIDKAEAKVATPESITDELTKVTALTAKGYGILNTFPTSEAGMKNMHFVMTNIITARAKAQFPDDKEARAQFINQKLYDNNIDPTDGIMYSNNMNFKIMSDVISAQGGAIANKMAELTNGIAAAKTDEERELLNNQLNQLVLEQHKTMDTYSKTAGTIIAGMDKSEVFPSEQETGKIPLPLAAEGYVPRIDNKGDLIVEFANGNRDALDLEMLIDSPESVKILPMQAQNYINTIKDRFFVDGRMIKPTREMFQPGAAGDKAFNDFLNIYKVLGIQDEMDLATAGGIGEIESPPKSNLKDADITKLKEKVTGDEIKIEELPPANTIVPKKKPDQPEEPKEKSLQEKIQEDFPSANVGTSGGDVNVKEGTKKKTDTQTQTEDVFEGSGVEPMYQSASLKEKYGEGGTTFQKLTKNKNMEFAYNYLNKTLSPEASAALLGNMYAEGGNFAFDQEEVTDRANKGYGLFQFTDVKDGEGHRTEYFKYLETNNKEDSIESQIDYVMDNINKGIGYDIGAGNRKKLQKIFKTGTVEQITKAFHDIFERPQPGSLKKRTNFAKEAFTFYRGI